MDCPNSDSSAQVVCTGKIPGPWFDGLRDSLQLSPYSVFNNGGLILDSNFETIYEAVLERKLVSGVLAACEQLSGKLTMIAISIPGLDHKYQMFTNDAKLDAPRARCQVDHAGGRASAQSSGRHQRRPVSICGCQPRIGCEQVVVGDRACGLGVPQRWM